MIDSRILVEYIPIQHVVDINDLLDPDFPQFPVFVVILFGDYLKTNIMNNLLLLAPTIHPLHYDSATRILHLDEFGAHYSNIGDHGPREGMVISDFIRQTVRHFLHPFSIR